MKSRKKLGNCTVVFTFDDGRDDSFVAAEILSSFGLVGTFFVTTGFVDGSFSTDAFGKGRRPVSVSELRHMKQLGMEIASHGDKHITSAADFSSSFEKLQNWDLIVDNKCGFSIPNSKTTTQEISFLMKKCGSNISYIRGGRHQNCYTSNNKIRYLLYNSFFKFQHIYDSFNKNNVLKSIDKKIIPSVVVKKRTSARNIINFISTLTDGECVVLMFHSVVESPKNEWEYSTNNFVKICSFLHEHKIGCQTLVNVVEAKLPFGKKR